MRRSASARPATLALAAALVVALATASVAVIVTSSAVATHADALPLLQHA
ncbi:hypothetical protein [Pseudoduganella chitinolytica]|uniref:Uncharacterized protein n=1 Tax=Pseudoduganella chitinolytica TaxID=34070 RepID=A0ABY8BGP6_9BURK|nr:hypothetical protein [Pseudoduganella chitinolytica]WEF34473.1 hypothetical protein PX653_06815 [Pseudoduganella chitinolytica]